MLIDKTSILSQNLGHYQKIMRKGEEEASFPPGFMEPGFTNAFFVVWSGLLC